MAGRWRDDRADSRKARNGSRGGARSGKGVPRVGANARRNPRGLRGDSGSVDGCGLGGSVAPQPLGNRRTRIAATIGKRLAGWLRKTARVHAHLCNVIRLYGQERKSASGTDEWRARALAGDQTILADALIVAIGELTQIHDSIDAAMHATPATSAPPGSPEKVAVMALRVARGRALFIDGDTQTDLRSATDRADGHGG